MPTMHLNDRKLRSLATTNAREEIWDSGTPGLLVRVSADGGKTFYVRYRKDGRRRRFKLGTYPALPLADARRRALEVLRDVELGEDPQENRQVQRKAPTVADLARRYLELHARAKKKPRSIEGDERNLRRHVLPAWGTRRVESINRTDVVELHHRMRKTPIQANRVLALVSKMMNLAEQWGLRPDGSNPCRHVQRNKENKRERFLSSEELARLGRALAEAERDASEHPSAILAIRLIALTGCRKGEILSLRWSEVDWEHRCLRLGESKTGRKIVPLGAPAIEALSAAHRRDGNPYVCAGERPKGHLVGLQRPWCRIRDRAGLNGVRLHDLRHGFASVGVSGGLGLPIIGALLGHTQPVTTARYAHLSNHPLREAADQIAGEIAAALGGWEEAAPSSPDQGEEPST